MGIIINHKKHYLTRLPLWLIGIVFVGLSPIIIGLLGASITERTTGQPCHEGNCIWMILPWLGMLSIPIGVIGLIIFSIIVLNDSISLNKRKTTPQQNLNRIKTGFRRNLGITKLHTKVLTSIPSILSLLSLIDKSTIAFMWNTFPTIANYRISILIFIVRIIAWIYIIRRLWSFERIPKNTKTTWTLVMIFVFGEITTLYYIWSKDDKLSSENSQLEETKETQ